MRDVTTHGLGRLGVPLLLRRVPSDRQHFAETLAARAAAAGDTWWELTDAAASADQAPAAVAVTRAPGRQIVHVELLRIDGVPGKPILMHLLRELFAALRRTDAVAVSVSADDAAVVAALLADGLISERGIEPLHAAYVVPL